VTIEEEEGEKDVHMLVEEEEDNGKWVISKFYGVRV